MSDETEVEVRVYSPRWGHEDTYTISMTRNWMKVEHHPRSATCKWVENKDPVWESATIRYTPQQSFRVPWSTLGLIGGRAK